MATITKMNDLVGAVNVGVTHPFVRDAFTVSAFKLICAARSLRATLLAVSVRIV